MFGSKKNKKSIDNIYYKEILVNEYPKELNGNKETLLKLYFSCISSKITPIILGETFMNRYKIIEGLKYLINKDSMLLNDYHIIFINNKYLNELDKIITNINNKKMIIYIEYDYINENILESVYLKHLDNSNYKFIFGINKYDYNNITSKYIKKDLFKIEIDKIYNQEQNVKKYTKFNNC